MKKWLLVIIEQVLSNCLKYTKSGGIDIYFKDNRLYLKDTGIGIKIVIFYVSLSVVFRLQWSLDSAVVWVRSLSF